MSTQEILTSYWSWNPAVLGAAVVAAAAYGWRCGWSRRAWWFVAALAVFMLTLLSPLDVLADGYVFSAHMVQHLLLLLVVPPLLLRSLPPSARLPRRLRVLARPAIGWGCGVGAMWFWHAPVLCNAAANFRSVFALQTVSLLVLGLAFWWQIHAPHAQDRLSPLPGVAYLFTACTACTLLGIILTFAPVTVCTAFLTPVGRPDLLATVRNVWGLGPAEDQQIGGLLMWVPACMIYLGAIFVELARWFGGAARPAVPAAAVRPAHLSWEAAAAAAPAAAGGSPHARSPARVQALARQDCAVAHAGEER